MRVILQINKCQPPPPKKNKNKNKKNNNNDKRKGGGLEWGAPLLGLAKSIY